jgi:hypothetical protein
MKKKKFLPENYRAKKPKETSQQMVSFQKLWEELYSIQYMQFSS